MYIIGNYDFGTDTYWYLAKTISHETLNWVKNPKNPSVIKLNNRISATEICNSLKLLFNLNLEVIDYHP